MRLLAVRFCWKHFLIWNKDKEDMCQICWVEKNMRIRRIRGY